MSGGENSTQPRKTLSWLPSSLGMVSGNTSGLGHKYIQLLTPSMRGIMMLLIIPPLGCELAEVQHPLPRDAYHIVEVAS